jgi:glutamyl-tRNA synthetase
MAWHRARAAQGKLVFRNEDLDYQRCKPEFVQAMYQDLRWLGLDWDEAPDTGGPFAPYSQSERRSFYLDAWRKLRDSGSIYPCTCSRKDLERALSAPHEGPSCGAQAPSPAYPRQPSVQPGTAVVQVFTDHVPTDDEAFYPGTCRNKITTAAQYDSPAGVSWRFRVPDGETVSFTDRYSGPQQFVAGQDFSDFLLWRRDDIPSYQLAVVVDDAAMQITEIVRGEDLLKSTARQLLLIRALDYSVPGYFHCPLLRDAKNVRLAKRHDALSLKTMREQGASAETLRKKFSEEIWKK